MTKQELDTLGYTYTNLTSGYVGLNYDTLIGAGEEFVSDILSALEPVITKDNLTDLVIGMDTHEISTGRTENTIQDISVQEIPDAVGNIPNGKAYRIDKSIRGLGVYENDFLVYAYVYGNEIQKKSKGSMSREKLLSNRVSELICSGNIQPATVLGIARSFLKISSIDDVDIRLYKTFPMKDTGILYNYDRHGLKKEQHFKDGALFLEKVYKEDVVVSTTYSEGLPVRIHTTTTGMYGIAEIANEIPTYENGVMVKTKITYSKRLTDAVQPVCYVHKFYQDNVLVKAKINDSKYGKKEYVFDGKNFTMEENGKTVKYTGKIEFAPDIDAMVALQELLMLEGGLIQLKNRLPEYKIDYSAIFNTIYTEKTNYAIAAIKEQRAWIYVADRGNTTIYDTNFNKAVYFPAEVVKKFLPTYSNYPNVMVEQRIREGNDPEAIRRLYELGTRSDDEETIYAFHRVVKSLSKNPATPADILKDITKRAHEGKFESSNIRFIVENPNTDEETLQDILNHKPSNLIVSCIEAHPHRPKKIKKVATAEDAKKAADAIFGNKD